MYLNIFITSFFTLNIQALWAQQSDLLLGAGLSIFLGDLGGKPGLATSDFMDINAGSTRYALTSTFRSF